MDKKRILFVGRFQPFHNGHLYILKKLLKSYDEVIIIAGSAESEKSWRNPFSAAERIAMISISLPRAVRIRTLIIPLRDINDHSKWVEHVNNYVPHYLAVYSNNEMVNSLFRAAGVAVIEGYYKRELYEGNTIREMIVAGNPAWKKLVPKPVSDYIIKNGFESRIRLLKQT